MSLWTPTFAFRGGFCKILMTGLGACQDEKRSLDSGLSLNGIAVKSGTLIIRVKYGISEPTH